MSFSNGLGKQENSVAGQLIIKASVGDDIRRIPILNDDLTYDELVLMMQRVFKGVLQTDEELILKYRDEDGDLVSLTDSNDLSHAIHYSRVLRLTILQPKAQSGENKSLVDLEVVEELRIIRDKVNHLLDKICSDKPRTEDNKVGEVTACGLSDTVANVANLNLEQNKEFDPLGQEQAIVATSEKTRQASGQSSASTASVPGQGQAAQPPQPPQAVYPAQSAVSYPSPAPHTQATPYPGQPTPAQYTSAASTGSVFSGAPGRFAGPNTYTAPAPGAGKSPYPGAPPSGPPTAHSYLQAQQQQQQAGSGAPFPPNTPNTYPGYPGGQPGPYGAPPGGSFNANNPYSRVQPGQGQAYPHPPQ